MILTYTLQICFLLGYLPNYLCLVCFEGFPFCPVRFSFCVFASGVMFFPTLRLHAHSPLFYFTISFLHINTYLEFTLV